MFCLYKHGSSSIQNGCISFQEFAAEYKMTSLVISSRMFVFFQKHMHVQISLSLFLLFLLMCKTLLKTIWHIFRTIINTESNVGSPASGLLTFFLFYICVVYTGRQVEAVRISFLPIRTWD